MSRETPALPPSPITTSVDLHAVGCQHGHLRLPHSSETSAWGSIMIPITVISNGEGPTALLTGGNHGDEYEGPIALHHLASTLHAADVQGRVIIIPSLNDPAFRAGRRTSPIDGGNLNRSFPGQPDGTVTQKIADYVQRVLLPQADVVLDFHSGGKSLDFVPLAASHILEDSVQSAACQQAMLAFNAPWSLTMLEIDSVGMLDTAAESMGKVFVTTELGGGGTSTARTARVAHRGVRNILIHMGILDETPAVEPTTRIGMPDSRCFVICEHDGFVEPLVDLAATVRNGEPIARIWSIGRTGSAPVVYAASRDGVLIGRHFPGLITAGDCLAVVAVPEN